MVRYHIVDAFADKIFSGNQAGVCVLESWPENALMQKIAQENNLSETAFIVRKDDHYGLRWFTPAVEIELCGHATLASAFVLFSFYDTNAQTLNFDTKSGVLEVERKGDLLEMNFPVRKQEKTEITDAMKRAVKAPILSAYSGYNLMLELENESRVRDLEPDITEIKKLAEYHGVIVTARGSDCDFVSRFFAPNVGVNEDPVTGSTHTSLVPFWSARLGKKELKARQLSKRGGSLYCRDGGERIFIAGKASLYLSGGEIFLDSVS